MTREEAIEALSLLRILDAPDLENAVKELKAYRDTGLTPEEILGLCSMDKRSRMAKMLRWEEAERDGRLVMLPCKIGGKLYRTSLLWEERVTDIEVDRQFISSGRITLFTHTQFQGGKMSTSYECFKNSDIGKTIFLTREEAEAALKKRGTGNEID